MSKLYIFIEVSHFLLLTQVTVFKYWENTFSLLFCVCCCSQYNSYRHNVFLSLYLHC